MLKRIYIDNYKCLVNFELNFDSLNLFLGPNGGGKSTIFEAFNKIRRIANGDSRVEEEFPAESSTRWLSSALQSFELEIDRDGHIFRYELGIDHRKQEGGSVILHERLWLDKKPLIQCEIPEAILYTDQFTEGTRLPFDGARSVVDFLPGYNAWISRFKQALNDILVIQLDPRLMSDLSEGPTAYPSRWLENYASWYQFLSRDQSWVFDLSNTLKEVLPGFEHFRYTDAWNKFSILKAVFSDSENHSARKEYRLAELSDGQRALIALYTLLIAAKKGNYVLFIDEPENYLALPEIQPWLIQLYDACSAGVTQAVLISHHPELINYLLASPIGIWFDRQTNRPTRIKRISAPEGGLPVAELIARGWLND
jgi:predicted ATPase